MREREGQGEEGREEGSKCAFYVHISIILCNGKFCNLVFPYSLSTSTLYFALLAAGTGARLSSHISELWRRRQCAGSGPQGRGQKKQVR